jgi:hypothetical protein
MSKDPLTSPKLTALQADRAKLSARAEQLKEEDRSLARRLFPGLDTPTVLRHTIEIRPNRKA